MYPEIRCACVITCIACRRDVYKRGVSVHIVEPGFFKTPLLGATANRNRIEEKLKMLPDVYKADLPPDAVDKSKT